MREAKRQRRGAWARLNFRQLTRGWVVINIADAALFLMVAAWMKDMTGSDAAAAEGVSCLRLASGVAHGVSRMSGRIGVVVVPFAEGVGAPAPALSSGTAVLARALAELAG